MALPGNILRDVLKKFSLKYGSDFMKLEMGRGGRHAVITEWIEFP
jgi:hypothetical protein